MQILLTCENSFQWFRAHSWSYLSEINKRSINRDEWQWEREWQLVQVLIGRPGQDQVRLGHRGLQAEARESRRGDQLRDILRQWTQSGACWSTLWGEEKTQRIMLQVTSRARTWYLCKQTACPLPNWARWQALKNIQDALNVVCKLKAQVMKTACPLPNWAMGQAINLVTVSPPNHDIQNKMWMEILGGACN